MHLNFSENEKSHIDMKPFNWSVKSDCPPSLKKMIARKLKMLKDESTYTFKMRKDD